MNRLLVPAIPLKISRALFLFPVHLFSALCFSLVLFGCSDDTEQGRRSTSAVEPVKTTPGYDPIAACAEMWRPQYPGAAPETIHPSESLVTRTRVTVQYSKLEPHQSTGVLVYSTGTYRCALDGAGHVGAYGHLCSLSSRKKNDGAHQPSLDRLARKFTWLKSRLSKSLGSKERLAEISPLGDLNADGIPELIDESAGLCGTSNCYFDFYAIDAAAHTVRRISGEAKISDRGAVTSEQSSGWSLLANTWCLGAASCACYIAEYDPTEQEYVLVERHSLRK